MISFKNFLEIKNQFELGQLTTEGINRTSKDLSYLKKTTDAIAICKKIDFDALEKIKSKTKELESLRSSIEKTLNASHKVYICGCGATGRLALSLEFLFRKEYQSDQVISFMAGGDYALIKSVESFEDKFSYGKIQLQELGFTKNDLLISITEGGETSFVIGASEHASSLGAESFFIYCNPDKELQNIKRSRLVLDDSSIQKINLSVGEMTVSGSTRMQATTVQMILTGIALLHFREKNCSKIFLSAIEELQKTNYSFLAPFIKEEFTSYINSEYVTYLSDPDYGICVLTDTTERSPTFSLRGFEKTDENEISLSYLCVQGEEDAKDAWCRLLGRAPRCLDWDIGNLGFDELIKFDISESSIWRRSKYGKNHLFKIIKKSEKIVFQFKNIEHAITKSSSLLIDHVKLKVLLNTLSTLIMCRLGRVEGNVMSYVRPSNLKLIDRAVRYIVSLSKDDINYEEALKRVFTHLPYLKENESIVLKCL